MRICQLRIKNFRGIKNTTITFSDHTVLFGANNVGKSTVIEALALLFERERLTRQISDWDFEGGQPRPDSRFFIIGTVTDFDGTSSDEPEEYPNWFLGDAGRPVWWNDASGEISTAIDRPAGSKLACQIALCVRYEEDSCEFESIRYFYCGECDPFTDPVTKLPSSLLQELGVFLLPSNRQWEKLLSFNSSSFLKVLKSVGAIPGIAVEKLKGELRSPHSRIEDVESIKPILERAEEELRGFVMLEEAARLVYRATSLDTVAVLQSLVPHILKSDSSILPFARQGAGMVSLQAFLVVLAFAEHRKSEGQNFILAAEEPELHLHPALHRRLANRVRSLSTQSIITTHSPLIAASYQTATSLFVRNDSGTIVPVPVKTFRVAGPAHKAVRKLYRNHRESLFEALMGSIVLVPEGESDFEWIRLWQRIAEASDHVAERCCLNPITIIPTMDGAIVDTTAEIGRFRGDAIALVDGDAAGTTYIDALRRGTCPPSKIIQFGQGAAIECFSAWILAPALLAPGAVLSSIVGESRTARDLQNALIKGTDRHLREDLCWESSEVPECALRAGMFLEDLARIANGDEPKNLRWEVDGNPGQTLVYRAVEISRA